MDNRTLVEIDIIGLQLCQWVNHNWDLLTVVWRHLTVVECWLPRLRITVPGCWCLHCCLFWFGWSILSAGWLHDMTVD